MRISKISIIDSPSKYNLKRNPQNNQQNNDNDFKNELDKCCKKLQKQMKVKNNN